MEEENKQLDQFTKEIIQEAGLTNPSVDFLANVMAEIAPEKASEKVYKPLISKVGWMLISSLLLVFSFVLTRFSLGFSILGDWDLSSLFVKKYDITFSIPDTYVYCSVFLLIFVIIQIKMIGKQFDKSLRE
ncbi:hypothetical protein U8527_11745 [Kordia algicida OT-1]|uniref:Uncharacterized protein n=1 Tax=Kordia algicida OT-1 TaxID=391587 RepID=A9E014_9FLAO|nr:hypothetical protein [Kordia algicida]EDP95787.1 hypothetical protein KAOT1_05267 [Kordia algicida OT-1]